VAQFSCSASEKTGSRSGGDPRELLEAGSMNAGVALVTTRLAVCFNTSEANGQNHATAEPKVATESSQAFLLNVSTTRVPVSKPLKLEKYNPYQSLFETCMAKMVNARKFNHWTEVEECAWVRNTLEGRAADVLWELGAETTSEVILETLKKRFGNGNHAEGYHALLLTHRMQSDGSIQAVDMDICCLLSHNWHF